MSVENSVSKITVSAKTEDSKAKITSGTGTYTLDEGTRAISIIVKAEDGTQKTYKISVNRKALNPETVPNVIDDQQEEKPEVLGLLELKLGEKFVLSPEFKMDVYNYMVELKEDIDKLEISAVPNIEGATIEILGNENLAVGENIITVLVKMDGYDTATYQIIVNKIIDEEEIPEKAPRDRVQQTNGNMELLLWIIAGLAFINCISGIVFAVLEYRYTKQNKDAEVVGFTPLGDKKKSGRHF